MALSVWQLKRQLAKLAGDALWIGQAAPAGLVFTGGAFVSEDVEGSYFLGSNRQDGPRFASGTDNAKGVTPFCRVRCDGFRYDLGSNAHRIQVAEFELFATAGGGYSIPGQTTAAGFDSHGENMHTGALRDAVQNDLRSQGRDSDELLSRFMDQLGGRMFVSSVHGFQGRARAGTRMMPVNGRSVQKRAVLVDAYDVVEFNTYDPGRRLLGTKVGADVILTWSLPASRFDTLRGVLRRGTLSGDAAPAAPGDGVAVALASDLAITATDLAPGVGTWKYSYFMGYAETPQALLANTPDHYSSPVSTTVVV